MKSSTLPGGDVAFPLAALAAVAAAIVIPLVWAPVQQRALALATATAPPVESTASAAQWLRVPFVTDAGNETNLQASNGEVRVVTMFYTHCPGVCPLAVSTLQQMQKRLSPAQQQGLSIVALSLDPQRDSLPQMRAFRAARNIPGSHWILGRPAPERVQAFATAMGVRYHIRYHRGDESLDHQSVFVLLDGQGRVLARTRDTSSIDPRFFGALQAAVANR